MSKLMKRMILAVLFAPFVLPSCETTHKAAVATFRVIDAPAAYVRRKLDVDQPAQTTTTTTETQAYSDTAQNPPSQPYPVQSPPPPSQRPVVAKESKPEPPAEGPTQSSVTPGVARNESPSHTQSTRPAAPGPVVSQGTGIPYGKPVPGKPGYVFSPFDKEGRYVDVSGFAPGTKVKDPWTDKIFLVP